MIIMAFYALLIGLIVYFLRKELLSIWKDIKRNKPK